MKKVEAIIQPFKLDEVKARVFAAGGNGMTVSEVEGLGRTGGEKEVPLGSAYAVDFVPKVRIQCFVDDDCAGPVVRCHCRRRPYRRNRRWERSPSAPWKKWCASAPASAVRTPFRCGKHPFDQVYRRQ